MGHDNHSQSGWSPDMDSAEHKSTYDGFIRITKWGIIALVALLIAMRVFLVPFAN